LQALEQGIEIDGVRYGAIKARETTRTGANAWLEVGLREGKNREVRKVLESMGLSVTRLIRTAYGPFQLGNLERGAVEEVRPSVLRDQLGHVLGDRLPSQAVRRGNRDADRRRAP